MSTEENKILIRKFLDEVYSKGNLSVADEIVASPICENLSRMQSQQPEVGYQMFRLKLKM